MTKNTSKELLVNDTSTVEVLKYLDCRSSSMVGARATFFGEPMEFSIIRSSENGRLS